MTFGGKWNQMTQNENSVTSVAFLLPKQMIKLAVMQKTRNISWIGIAEALHYEQC
jgi:hypothetical protein